MAGLKGQGGKCSRETHEPPLLESPKVSVPLPGTTLAGPRETTVTPLPAVATRKQGPPAPGVVREAPLQRTQPTPACAWLPLPGREEAFPCEGRNPSPCYPNGGLELCTEASLFTHSMYLSSLRLWERGLERRNRGPQMGSGLAELTVKPTFFLCLPWPLRAEKRTQFRARARTQALNKPE